MVTVTLLPISDAGPNDGSASPNAPHWQNFDDEPTDGDATYVSLSFAGTREVCALDVSNIPEGSTILAFRIRWAAKTGASLAQGRAGIRMGANYYFAPERVLLSGYPAFDETVTHPDGNPWTKARIAVAFAALELFSIEDDTMLPRPRFSELVGLADIIPPPERPVAVDAAVAGSAAVSGGQSAAGAAAIAPSASEAAIAPAAIPSAIAGASVAAAVVASGTAAAIASAASPSDAGKPSAIPSPVGPTAYPASLSPLATVAIIEPEAEVS